MTRRNPSSLALRLAAAALGALMAVPCLAQSDESRPLLQQLDRETQSLYTQVQRGVVRVQLPPPKFVAAEVDNDHPLDRYGPVLNDPMKKGLAQQRSVYRAGNSVELHVDIAPTGQAAPSNKKPATAPAATVGATTTNSGWKITRSADGTQMEMEPVGGSNVARFHTGGERDPSGQVAEGGATRLDFAAGADFAPNNVGLLLDNAGHFLVPMFVDADQVSDKGVRISLDQVETTARFVGSDRQTNLTILQLDRNDQQQLGKPVHLSKVRPADGALVMLLAPGAGTGRLIIWTGNVQDMGIIANIDGTVAGFVRYGQFLSGHACGPVIEQLIATGHVNRANLGMHLSELPANDPARRASPALANRPALKVDEVKAGSLAESAKMQPGDLIFAMGSEPVGDVPTFAAFLAGRSGKTTLQAVRGEETVMITLDLPERPSGKPRK